MHAAAAGGNRLDLVDHPVTLGHFAEYRISPAIRGFALVVQKIVVFHVDEKLGRGAVGGQMSGAMATV